MLILRQSTAIDIRMGPFVDATDGVTPETGVTLGAADQAEVLKADGAATVAMAGTFAAVTGADGWYDYTVASGDVDTVGEVVFVVQDSSVCLPVFVRGYVVEEAVYDAMYDSAAAGPLQSTTAGRTLDVTATGAAGIDWGNIENPTTVVDLSGTDINLVDTATSVTNQVTADVTAISGDTTAANNLEADYDGTGYNKSASTIGTATNVTNAVTVTGTPDVNVAQISGDSVAANNLEADYDGTGYNKSNSTIGTCTTNTDMVAEAPTAAANADAVWDEALSGHVAAGSAGKAVADIETDATDILADTNELQGDWADGGRLDVILDARASQASVDALNDVSVSDILTTQMTESYAADGTAPTLAQALFLIQQSIGDFSITGTTITVNQLDGTTTAATYTLDDGTSPTSRTRAT